MGEVPHSCPQRVGSLSGNQNMSVESSQWTEFKRSSAYMLSFTQPVMHEPVIYGLPPGVGSVCAVLGNLRKPKWSCSPGVYIPLENRPQK